MKGSDVIHLYTELERAGVFVLIDGGWGGLMPSSVKKPGLTRIWMLSFEKKMFGICGFVWGSKGYADYPREDTSTWNFVLRDASGREVDVHVICFDAAGNGIYGPAERGQMYPAESLMGVGTIQGQRVRCISPEWMVKFHSGYALTEKDHRDVRALCKRFLIDLPEEYARQNDGYPLV